MARFSLVPTLIVLWATIRIIVACSHGDVRLVNGSTVYDGLVEVCVNREWNRVCALDWYSSYEGTVVCRQLGCTNGAVAYREGLGTENGVLIDFCSSRSASLFECSYLLNYNCNGWAEVGVRCIIGDTPDMPENLQAPTEFIWSTSLMLTWQPPTTNDSNCSLPVSEYQVTCNPGAYMYTSSATSRLITGLQPYTYYNCCVLAISNMTRSNSVCISTRTLEAAPSCPPTNLQSNPLNSTPTTLYLTWTAPLINCTNGVIDRYIVRICRGSGTTNCTTVNSSTTSLRVYSLQPYYHYNVTVSAYTVAEGPYVKVNGLTTQQNIPNSSPQHLLIDILDPTSVHMSWIPPLLEDQNGVIRGYNITITNADTIITNFTEQTFIIVYNLHPHYYYTCSVAVYTVGIGPYANHQVMMPEDVPSGRPSSLRLRTLDSRRLHLSWQPPSLDQQNGVIRSYQVNVCRQQECSYYNITRLTLTINNLHPYYWYEVFVAAFTVGLGPSVTRFIQMPEDFPNSSPRHLLIDILDPTSVHMSWSPPLLEDQNGVIRGYNITITNADTNIRLRKIFTEQTFFTVYNLHPHYNYTCSVAAYTVGAGPYANFSVMMPEDAPSSPPRNLLNSTINSTSVILSWDPPPIQHHNGVIRYYNVTLSNTTMMESYNVTETLLTLTQLTPNSTYYWSIAAYTVSIGPFSNEIKLYMPSLKKSKALEIGLYSTAGVLFLVFIIICVLCCWAICHSDCGKKLKRSRRKQGKESDDTLKDDKNQPQTHDRYTFRLPWKRPTLKTKHSEKKQQSTDSHLEDNHYDMPTPALPERQYLEDIDFVAGEFDMILNTRPDLPERDYLEDIDFVVGEIMFPKKEGENNATPEEGTLEMKYLNNTSNDTSDSDTPQSPRNNTYKQGNGDRNTVNNQAADESHYQPLTITQGTNQCSEYDTVQIRSKSSAVTQSAENNNSTGHYQPLLLHKHQQKTSEYATVGAHLQTPTAPKVKTRSRKRDMKELAILPKPKHC